MVNAIRFNIFLCNLALLAFCACNDPISNLPSVPANRWQQIPEFAGLDIRYMLNEHGILTVAAVRDLKESVIYQSKDGFSWELSQSFTSTVGPLAYKHDTLFCVCTDSIYYKPPSGSWKSAFRTPDKFAEAQTICDIVFFRDTLYVMSFPSSNTPRTFRVSSDGTAEEVLVDAGVNSYTGAKFLKTFLSMRERLFVRQLWMAHPFYEFDGYLFNRMDNGLSYNEMFYGSPTNSMTVHNDTLIVGFKYPGAFKIWTNDRWTPYLDTLPYPNCAFTVTPTLRTEPTAIVFLNNIPYVSTHCMGILRFAPTRRWEQISCGLVPGTIPGVVDSTLFAPVVFLESFGDALFAGYGTPGYAPWGGSGLYKLTPK